MSARVMTYAGEPGMSCGCARPRRRTVPSRAEVTEEATRLIPNQDMSENTPAGLVRKAYVPAGGW